MKSQRKRIFLTWALLFSALSTPFSLKAAAEVTLSADQLFTHLQNGRHEKLDTFSLPSSGNITIRGQQKPVSEFQKEIIGELMKKNDFYRVALMLKRFHITEYWSQFLEKFLKHIKAKKSLNLAMLRVLAEIPWNHVIDTKGSVWHPYILNCKSSSRYNAQDEGFYACQEACFQPKTTRTSSQSIQVYSLQCLWQSLLTWDLSITKKVSKMSHSSSRSRSRSDYGRGSSHEVEEIEDRKILQEVKKRLLENASSLNMDARNFNTALLDNILEKEKEIKERRRERGESGSERGRRLEAPAIPSIHGYSSRGGDGYSSRGGSFGYDGLDKQYILSDLMNIEQGRENDKSVPLPTKVVRFGRPATSVRTVPPPSPTQKT